MTRTELRERALPAPRRVLRARRACEHANNLDVELDDTETSHKIRDALAAPPGSDQKTSPRELRHQGEGSRLETGREIGP